MLFLFRTARLRRLTRSTDKCTATANELSSSLIFQDRMQITFDFSLASFHHPVKLRKPRWIVKGITVNIFLNRKNFIGIQIRSIVPLQEEWRFMLCVRWLRCSAISSPVNTPGFASGSWFFIPSPANQGNAGPGLSFP